MGRLTTGRPRSFSHSWIMVPQAALWGSYPAGGVRMVHFFISLPPGIQIVDGVTTSSSSFKGGVVQVYPLETNWSYALLILSSRLSPDP